MLKEQKNNTMINWFQVVVLFISSLPLMGQTSSDTIKLNNPSFEDVPHAGTETSYIRGWQDCGATFFRGETPPDIHNGLDPASKNVLNLYFGVNKKSSDGNTFLGFVVRENDTYESVSQRLSRPLEAGSCYTFSIDLSKSSTYISPYPETASSQYYIKPVVLRIYGGVSSCSKRELLAESTEIDHDDWKTYTFEFKPTQEHRYIVVSAFYKVPNLFPYNGNLLLDNASVIVKTQCPGEEPLVAEEPEVEVEPEIVETSAVPAVTEFTKPAVAEKPVEAQPDVKEKEVVLKPTEATINRELNRKTLKKGQTINLKNLYFDANAIEINSKSYPALQELAVFLKENNDVRIEIGGHTNGRPSQAFCDSLSTARAKSVATYLFNDGIPEAQVEYKGYGKRNPIASDKYAEGRARNQRVEIKVLTIGEE